MDQADIQRAERDLWNIREVKGDLTVINQSPIPLTVTINETRPPLRCWQVRPEEQVLTGYLTNPQLQILGVYGAGGYGKSALAAKLFENITGFQQKFWANFQQPASFNTFARWLGYKFGYQFEEQWSDELLAQQAINCLSENRCLLVLDNLETLLQNPVLWQPYYQFLVHWLESSNQSCILLTTQQRVDLPTSHWEWQELRGLSIEQGINLLRQYGVEGEEADLEEFVILADQHPLLLTLAANSLLRRAKRDQENAAILTLQRDNLAVFRQITDLHRGDPVASVGAVLDRGYQQLPPHLKIVLRRVSVYRLAEFHIAMAQAMSPEATLTEQDLRALADCSFLLEKRHPDSGWCFSFQPLIQRYLQQVLQEAEDWLNAHQFAVDYFAARRQNPFPSNVDRTTEAAAIVASVETFHHLCELQQYLTAFNSVFRKTDEQDDLEDFLKRRGFNQIRLEMFGRLITEWQPENEEEYFGYRESLRVTGESLQMVDQWHEAMQLYEQVALPLVREVEDQWGEANTLRAIGDVLQFLDQRSEALQRYDEALTIYQQVGDRLGEANTLKAIGDVLQFLKQSSEALQRYDEALTIYQQVGARLGEANTLQAIGDIQSDPKAAMEYFQSAWQIYTNIQDKYSQARLLAVSIAPTQHNLGQTELAVASFQQAAQLAREISFTPLEEYALTQIESLTQSRKNDYLPFFLGLVLLLFIVFNLFRGHWLIALIGAAAFLIWQFLRRR